MDRFLNNHKGIQPPLFALPHCPVSAILPPYVGVEKSAAVEQILTETAGMRRCTAAKISRNSFRHRSELDWSTVLNRFQKRREATRAALRAAAIDLILERGYDAVSITDITERADVGRGTFYLHFTDKADVVTTALLDTFGRLEQAARARLETAPPDQRDYLNSVWFFHVVKTQLSLLRQVMNSSGASAVNERVKAYIGERERVRLNENNPFLALGLPPEYAAQHVAATLLGTVNWWAENEEGYTPEQVADLFYRALYRRPPPGR
jgi:AcrR family transcriptional regulator